MKKTGYDTQQGSEQNSGSCSLDPVVRFVNFEALLLAVAVHRVPTHYTWEIDNWYRNSGGNWIITMRNEYWYSEEHEVTPEELFLFLANTEITSREATPPKP